MGKVRRLAPSAVLWLVVLLGFALISWAYSRRDDAIVRVGRLAEKVLPRPAVKRPPLPTKEDPDSMWMRRKLEDDPDFLRHREERRAARKANK